MQDHVGRNVRSTCVAIEGPCGAIVLRRGQVVFRVMSAGGISLHDPPYISALEA